jgi:phosphoribosylformylglycinamidine (FGAM) synthase-like enzyme
LKSNLISLTGLISETLGASSKFSGDLDIKKAVNFIKLVRKLSFADGVTATRAVGKFGALYALSRMCLGGLGAEIKTSNINNFSENFYEVIVAVRAENTHQFQELFNQQAEDSFSLERLGVVKGECLRVNGLFEASILEINEAYRGSWEKNFERIS